MFTANVSPFSQTHVHPETKPGGARKVGWRQWVQREPRNGPASRPLPWVPLTNPVPLYEFQLCVSRSVFPATISQISFEESFNLGFTSYTWFPVRVRKNSDFTSSSLGPAAKASGRPGPGPPGVALAAAGMPAVTWSRAFLHTHQWWGLGLLVVFHFSTHCS